MMKQAEMDDLVEDTWFSVRAKDTSGPIYATEFDDLAEAKEAQALIKLHRPDAVLCKETFYK